MDYCGLYATLDSPITFTINGKTYCAENGMYWYEWCPSVYNTDGFYIQGGTNFLMASNGSRVLNSVGNVTLSGNSVLSDVAYTYT